MARRKYRKVKASKVAKVESTVIGQDDDGNQLVSVPVESLFDGDRFKRVGNAWIRQVIPSTHAKAHRQVARVRRRMNAQHKLLWVRAKK